MSNAIRLGFAIVALIGAAAGNAARNEARAADMPVLKAPMRAAAYDWTGFYLGVNAGGSAGKASTDVLFSSTSFLVGPGPFALGSTSQFLVGGLGGVQAG
jgi:outer membrane immunogenic protein